MPIASSLLNKPRLVEKLRKFYNFVQKNDGKVGNKTRGIDLNFNNACNLRCKYCFTNSPKGDHVKEYLDIGAIKKLAEYKVSRVSVSIDSMDEKIHDEIRGRKESWKRAIEGLKHVQAAGMDPYLNITVGHYNANTDHFKQLLDYSKDNNYKTLLNVAVPAGMWQKMTDIICDEKDREYLKKMRKEYKKSCKKYVESF